VCGAPTAPPIVATCPGNLSLAFGVNGVADLSATDADGIVNSAIITSAAVPGISLVNFQPASAAGGVATASLNVAASVKAGTYPVTVKFGNDQTQEASCAISVAISAPAGITHTIPQIQGEGDASPYAGSVQTTEGVVRQGRLRLLPPGPGRRRQSADLGRPVCLHHGRQYRHRAGRRQNPHHRRIVNTPQPRHRNDRLPPTSPSWPAASASRQPISSCHTPTWARWKACWCASASR
jgi:hypothetical protein